MQPHVHAESIEFSQLGVTGYPILTGEGSCSLTHHHQSKGLCNRIKTPVAIEMKLDAMTVARFLRRSLRIPLPLLPLLTTFSYFLESIASHD
jgi:hypothetical protein